MNPNSNFYSENELKLLKEHRVRFAQDMIVEARLAPGRKIVELETEKFNNTLFWISSLALAIIPLVGFVLIIDMYLKQSSFTPRFPDRMEIYMLEVNALDAHIKRATEKVQRARDVASVSLLNIKIEKGDTTPKITKRLPLELVQQVQSFLTARQPPVPNQQNSLERL